MHEHALGVTTLKEEGATTLRNTYAKLFEAFPRSTLTKVGHKQLTTDMGRATAIVQLVSKHSGEVVELDRFRSSWVLRPVSPGSASDQWGGGNGTAWKAGVPPGEVTARLASMATGTMSSCK